MRIWIYTISSQAGDKIHKFKKPLVLEGEKVEGGFCLTHKELNLSACEKSWRECIDIIREELTILWEEYALAPDDELTADAIALKTIDFAKVAVASCDVKQMIKALKMLEGCE